MGGTESKTTTDILTDIAVNVVQRNVNKCVGTVNNIQRIKIKSLAGKVEIKDTLFKQNASVDLKCLLTSESQSKIQSDIANEIVQYADSQGQAVLSALGSTSAEAETNVKTMLEQNVTQETISETAATIANLQEIDVGEITETGELVLDGVTFEQSAKIMAESYVTSTSVAEAISSVANTIDQTAKAKEEGPLDFIGDIFGNMVVMAAIGAAIVGLILLVVFVIPMMQGKDPMAAFGLGAQGAPGAQADKSKEDESPLNFWETILETMGYPTLTGETYREQYRKKQAEKSKAQNTPTEHFASKPGMPTPSSATPTAASAAQSAAGLLGRQRSKTI